jgi:GGDEF domain-containing protein
MGVSDASKDIKKKSEGGGFLEALAFPPFLLVPIFIVTLLAKGNSSASAPIFVPAVFALLISYGAMSILFVSLRKSGMKRAANAVSFLSSGVLLLFLSFAMGLGDVFGWVGTALIGCGLVLAMSQIVTSAPKRFTVVGSNLLPDSVSQLEIKKLLDAMAFPSAFLKMDEAGEERVVAINEPFAAILGKNNNSIKDTLFSSVLPNNENAVNFKLGNAKWVPHRTTRGTQTLFMLTPMVKAQEDESSGPTDAIDKETGLFTPLFLKYRAGADVEACRRYGRKLSVVLFRLSFNKLTVKPSEEIVRKACAEFGKLVIASLRACDSGYRLNDHEVLLYLPDTPQSGSKTVVGRILGKVKKLSSVECVELDSANVDEVTINYFGDEVSSVNQVMKDIYVEMGRLMESQMRTE